MVKRIAAKKKPDTAPPEKIEVEFARNGGPEYHTFQPLGVMDSAALALALRASKSPEQSLEGMMRLIRKQMSDTDGVPARWKPELYKAPEEPADPGGMERVDDFLADESSDPDRPDEEDLYVGPDGKPYPYSEVEQFTTFDAGSSRRRWLHLVEEDDEVLVEQDVITGVFKHMVSVGAKRPTQRPS